MCVLGHTCKSSTWEAEAGGVQGLVCTASSRPTRATYRDPDSKQKETNQKWA